MRRKNKLMTITQLHQQYFLEFKNLISNSEINNLFDLPKTEYTKLDFEYLVQVSSVFSSKIEGNSLDLNSYFNTKDSKVKTKSKEITEIQDLSAAYLFAELNAPNLPNFFKAHAILVKTFLDKPNQGKVRTNSVGVLEIQD